MPRNRDLKGDCKGAGTSAKSSRFVLVAERPVGCACTFPSVSRTQFGINVVCDGL